ncbi:unnamed protein product [Effrenium voratum]|nr:unnamed protein product [Effrenium voratum]
MPTDFSMENMPHTSPHRKPVRSRSISSWVRCRDELLSGIFRELCELGPACRRQVLQQHFSQGQRAALEQWMLRRRSTPKPLAVASGSPRGVKSRSGSLAGRPGSRIREERCS